MRYLGVIVAICLFSSIVQAQEEYITGFEISIDQDNFVDFLRDQDQRIDRNYTVGLRLGFYGANANSIYLGLPFVRQLGDDFIIDNLLFKKGFREQHISHNFAFTINGFSPSHISDETDEFALAVANGYEIANDRPFSSFTGFRSSRRLEVSKRYAHSAAEMDLAINTSFTVGFGSVGLVKGVENLLGAGRPSANLWSEDEDKPYPTGQPMRTWMPLIMYSISTEMVVLRPMKKVLLQARPEMNLGYYTNIGLGFDFGKVMNVERHIDNLSYTDTNNPSTLAVSDQDLAFSIVGGITARAVLHNAHLNGILSNHGDRYGSLQNKKGLLLEGYIGMKVQFLQKIEFSFSINQRSADFNNAERRNPYWGTIGIKYLMASAGVGCYD